MKYLAASLFGTYVLVGTCALAAGLAASQGAQAQTASPPAPAARAAAQMTTCSTAARKSAQANPGMPVAGSTTVTTDKNGATDYCQQKDNGTPGNTATGH